MPINFITYSTNVVDDSCPITAALIANASEAPAGPARFGQLFDGLLSGIWALEKEVQELRARVGDV
jgi:hypothetical protein